ncbi:MAG: hypothetical protein FD170_2022 [Bacteroidetes bacterium]|jgi:hypothetical protein|nr:MAG: hypothetical protein FD170_2022 [Bacteroidota bacterium]
MQTVKIRGDKQKSIVIYNGKDGMAVLSVLYLAWQGCIRVFLGDSFVGTGLYHCFHFDI